MAIKSLLSASVGLLLACRIVFAHEETRDNSWWWDDAWWDDSQIEVPENYPVKTEWVRYQSGDLEVPALVARPEGEGEYPPVLFQTVDGVEQDTSVGLEGRGDQAWDNVADHFIACILDGIECEAPLANGLAVQQMMEAVLKSARTGREIRLRHK